MKRSLTALSVCISAVLMSSCGPLVYTNYGPTVPLLNEKGETSLTAGMNITSSTLLEDELIGASLTGATAVGNNVGLAGAFHISSGRSDDDWSRRSSYWELSAGWFKQKKGPFMFEIYGGPGFGTINNSSPTNADVRVKFMKPFIQPSIGWRFKSIDLAITSRFSYVSYTSDRVFYIDQEPVNLGNDSFSWDPAFTFRVGKTVKFQYQMGYSTFQSDWEYYNYYQHNLFFSAGIAARWPASR